jgi:tetratricopeptide (TPR) repeat protein
MGRWKLGDGDQESSGRQRKGGKPRWDEGADYDSLPDPQNLKKKRSQAAARSVDVGIAEKAKGYAALNQRKLEQAERHFRTSLLHLEGVKSGKDRRHALMGLGHCMHNGGRFQEAIDIYTELAGQESGDYLVNVLYNRAQAYSITRQDDLALADYRSALKINPYHSEILIDGGILLCRSGMQDEGLKWLRAADLSAIKEPKKAVSLASALYHFGEPGEAAAIARPYAEAESPEIGFVKLHYESLDQAGRKRYRGVIEDKIRARPLDISLRLAAGQLAVFERDYSVALGHAKKMMELAPKDADGPELMADTLRKQKRYAESLKYFDKAHALSQKPSTLICKAYSLMHLDMFDEAERTLDGAQYRSDYLQDVRGRKRFPEDRRENLKELSIWDNISLLEARLMLAKIEHDTSGSASQRRWQTAQRCFQELKALKPRSEKFKDFGAYLDRLDAESV